LLRYKHCDLPVAWPLLCGWATGVTHSLTRAVTWATVFFTVQLRCRWLRWKT